MGIKHAPAFKTDKAKAQEALAARQAEELANPHPPTPTPSPPPPPTTYYITESDDFGRYREYVTRPTLVSIPTPSASVDHPSLIETTSHMTTKPDELAPGLGSRIISTLWAPFKCITHFLMMEYHYTGTNTKNMDELQSLLLNTDVSKVDVASFNLVRETTALDEHDQSSRLDGNGWQPVQTVPIRLPCEKSKVPEDQAPILHVPGVHHRSLINVIKSVFEDKEALTFENTPFKEFWKSGDQETEPERMFGEMYTSDAWLEAQAEVDQIPVADPAIENVIACLMFWSDSTHLANFGNASLWPVYMLFGNQSKYTRAKPTSFAAHHVAYLPSVSLSILYSKFPLRA